MNLASGFQAEKRGCFISGSVTEVRDVHPVYTPDTLPTNSSSPKAPSSDSFETTFLFHLHSIDDIISCLSRLISTMFLFCSVWRCWFSAQGPRMTPVFIRQMQDADRPLMSACVFSQTEASAAPSQPPCSATLPDRRFQL